MKTEKPEYFHTFPFFYSSNFILKNGGVCVCGVNQKVPNTFKKREKRQKVVVVVASLVWPNPIMTHTHGV
jgi:hypothetical protein